MPKLFSRSRGSSHSGPHVAPRSIGRPIGGPGCREPLKKTSDTNLCGCGSWHRHPKTTSRPLPAAPPPRKIGPESRKTWGLGTSPRRARRLRNAVPALQGLHNAEVVWVAITISSLLSHEALHSDALQKDKIINAGNVRHEVKYTEQHG